MQHHRYRARPARANYKSSSYKDMFVRVPPQTVQDREKWRCRQCGKEVSNPWHHSHTHRQERFYCPQCGNSYNRIDSLKAHYRSAHAGPAPLGVGGMPPGMPPGMHLQPAHGAHPQHHMALSALPALPPPHGSSLPLAASCTPPNHNSH